MPYDAIRFRRAKRACALGAAALLVALFAAGPSAGADGDVDRSAPPTLGPPPSLQLPPIQRFELSNGLDVWLLEKHSVPIVQVDLLIRSGSVAEPSGKNGLSEAVTAMLDEGAGSMDALELSDAIAFLGAELETWSDLHSMGVDLSVPVVRLGEALTLMADVSLRPTFPAEELERLRAELLTQLLQDRDEPRAIASVLFQRTLFGKDHPYGASQDEASLRGISVADLKAFHGAHFLPGNATLIVVGDVTADEARPLLEASFGSWIGAAVEEPKVAKAPQVEGRTVYLVDKPGAAQSEIRIGRIGVDRQSPDYFALTVMNTLLGGSFTSRLNSNLREDKGYTYGAGSRFDFEKSPGAFLAASAVQTEVTDKALVEFMKELEGISEISDEELERARGYVALRFPRAFQTASGIADQLSELVLYDLPEDYFNHYVERILAVTREDAVRVAKQYVDPDNIAVVVVGDREVIGAGVEALGLGPIRQLTVEDVLGPAPELGN